MHADLTNSPNAPPQGNVQVDQEIKLKVCIVHCVARHHTFDPWRCFDKWAFYPNIVRRRRLSMWCITNECGTAAPTSSAALFYEDSVLLAWCVYKWCYRAHNRIYRSVVVVSSGAACLIFLFKREPNKKREMMSSPYKNPLFCSARAGDVVIFGLH